MGLGINPTKKQEKRPGRKPLPDEKRRDKVVAVSLAPAEVEAIDVAAAKYHLPRATFVRRAALNIADLGFIERVAK